MFLENQYLVGFALSFRLYGTNLQYRKYRISNSNQWSLTYFHSLIYSEPRNMRLEVSFEVGQ